MIFDMHVHTKMSTDSKMEPDEAIRKAESLGLGSIFTEHYDPDYVGDKVNFRVNAAEYMSAYEKYRSSKVLLGIEIGMTHMSAEANKNLAGAYGFDYVLGAVHMVGDIDIYIDLTNEEYPIITPESYLDYALRMVEENDFYDALAHIDYPCRYINGRPIDLSLKTHSDRYDAILKALIRKGKPIEVNTRRFEDKNDYEEMYAIYKRYYELGGRLVTLGSDAHRPSSIGAYFSQGTALIKEIGLTPVYFKNRRMIACD